MAARDMDNLTLPYRDFPAHAGKISLPCRMQVHIGDFARTYLCMSGVIYVYLIADFRSKPSREEPLPGKADQVPGPGVCGAVHRHPLRVPFRHIGRYGV